MVQLQFFLGLTLLLSASSSPITKVLELLGDMQAKVKKEASEAEEAVKEQDLFCERRASDLGNRLFYPDKQECQRGARSKDFKSGREDRDCWRKRRGSSFWNPSQ